MIKRYLLVLLALGATVFCANGYDEKIAYVDYGFDPQKFIDVRGAEIHSNAAPDEMKKRGLEYTFRIYKNGTRERYAPAGSNITAYDYSRFAVSYHAGKGVMVWNDTAENLNLKLIGIGFIMGINETPTTDQLKSAAELLAKIKAQQPNLSIIATQTAFSGYRMNGTLLCNSSVCRVNQEGLIPNAWNFPAYLFANYLNYASKPYGSEWEHQFGYGWMDTEYWPIEYIFTSNNGRIGGMA